MKTKLTFYVLLGWLIALLAGCSARVPENARALAQVPRIYPDYVEVMVPVNIAPLNFKISEPGDGYVARVSNGAGQEIVAAGPVVDFPVDKWHALLANVSDGRLKVEVYVRNKGAWTAFAPFDIYVAESVDPYITYRQLQPSYINYEVMSINQRCLENFDEEVLLSNTTLSDDDKGQCLNCHAVQDYNRGGNMQLHVRAHLGGTVVKCNGQLRKVTLKNDSTISNGVYPAWHPELPLIAYSTNETHQSFHSASTNKIEVQDQASDLVLYDPIKNTTKNIASDTAAWETFPAWSPDGNMLYYAVAPYPDLEELSLSIWLRKNYKDIKYDICRKPFDRGTLTFGPADTVVAARCQGASATLPRVSPDGRYLLYTLGEYGTFHIWHPDADLWLLDLQTGESRALTELNSTDTESYHSWSSNGRWILFSSRRDDGSYTRLYLAYFNDGIVGKPFLLPQRSPDQNILLTKSYNVPEFMAAPSTVGRKELIDVIKGEAITASAE